mmetsp:Transcript_13988/g.16913  ORF Transcript_13988/g.16913 Transcript_13988/m.16913 type:complete len:705 (+) Transcript_13988:278-2392(+)|eukprot:CAMPEP_0197845468 /NCGR_PEP_ID=MMETSP1438-20131217/2392_1 /TAXON_ID=1461541 /ORGANISM="Pterosperma sp., Strain CCMP1384" /LENGTH=704 /DNA_ID=CAMNT_0043456769 /DNA_START=278 /DNA_END=2392 /DNA_ORIENTATION=-
MSVRSLVVPSRVDTSLLARRKSHRPRPLRQSTSAKRVVLTLSRSVDLGVKSAKAGSPTSLSSFDDIATKFKSVSGQDRFALLLKYARESQPFGDEERTLENRVMGCTAQVWLTSRLGDDGLMYFRGDSDSEISRGLMAVLTQSLSGLAPEEVLGIPLEVISELGLAGTGPITASRSNSLYNILETMKKKARRCASDYSVLEEPFPSLSITADELVPQGAFAEAQATYLKPDAGMVARLTKVLKEKSIGVVAHFYMGPEVQGVLSAAAEEWPHIHISDSLVMADNAVKMVEKGCKSVVVLGVDFMAENAQTVLEAAGYGDVNVYRLSSEDIGCSLAEAAEAVAYQEYLSKGAAMPGQNLHVVYINTSLRTKAQAQSIIPTITCTSSNVVRTILQAAAQVPDVNIWYGPDTYMGGNLADLFNRLAELGDDAIAKLHPAHNRETIKSLIPRFRYFREGTCIVHHLFGGEVVDIVRNEYGDAYQTAHFEVPGDMFALAMEAQERDMGTVGSTQNILDFIKARVEESLAREFPEKLQFVLGTETGMITTIVNTVQEQLRAGREQGLNEHVTVQVVFPVSTESMTQLEGAPGAGTGGLADMLEIVPGPSGGEGCSSSGGCASCPYMKMNSLSALLHVCETIDTPQEASLAGYLPNAYGDVVVDPSNPDATIAKQGYVPILSMRAFQTSGKLPDNLIQDMEARAVHVNVTV